MKGGRSIGKEEAVLKGVTERLTAVCIASRMKTKQAMDKLEAAMQRAEGKTKEVLLKFVMDAEEFIKYIDNELTAHVLKMTRLVGILIEKSRWGVKGTYEQILKITESALDFYRQLTNFMLEKVGRGVYTQIMQLADEIKEHSKEHEEQLLTPESAEEIVREIEEAKEGLKIKMEKKEVREKNEII